MSCRYSTLLVVSLPLAFVAGCGEAPIAHYRIAKPDVPVAVATAPHAGGAMAQPAPAPAEAAAPAAAPAELKWSAPEHWQAQPASGSRRATYPFARDGKSAELAVTLFPGDVGGELPNLNRWRGQVGLGPWSAADQAAAVQRLEVNQLQIAVADFTGTAGGQPVRLLAAIVPAGDMTWFFKFTGAPELVEQEKAHFLTVLQTLHMEGGDDACCAH